MPKKTKEETEITRHRILETALELFHRQGFVRTTLQQIAEKAGYTRGAVYWHYKNKEELLYKLSEEVEGEVQQEIDAIFSSRCTSLEDVIELVQAFLLLFETYPRYRKLYEILYLRTEWTEELAFFRQKDREELEEIIAFLGNTFRKLQKQGTIPKEIDPEDPAREVTIFITGVLNLWLWHPELFSLQEDVPRMLRHTLEGYGR